MIRTLAVLLSSLSLFLLMVTAQDPKITCKEEEGKVYSQCDGHCQPTCDNFTPMCPEKCEPGCLCKKGTVADKNGKCVKNEACCTGGNTTYSAEGNDCGKFCRKPGDPLVKCSTDKFPGCFCLPGYVPEAFNSKRCILKAECPVYNTS
ncbi:hypothetical protein GDO81_019693 [Engystomops pustulosus]|uniref:TIL domain-containing protein n=1 Tax=Engystomops pustulosus TaxID=76066 RepID=A0AAV6ZIV8_ENGPU|nr:hypothetical protein GDO81_019693 [Engystomops pustulosus]KAG8546144.1 hypothetical protein GDO81_019693 [Engystomops pustulosus]